MTYNKYLIVLSTSVLLSQCSYYQNTTDPTNPMQYKDEVYSVGYYGFVPDWQ